MEDFIETFSKLKLSASVVSHGGVQDATNFRDVIYEKSDSEREADKAIRVIGDEVVNLASKIIARSLDLGASDIHIEEERERVPVRFRVGGGLVDWDQMIPVSFGKGLVARYKVLAGLDITTRRVPQDGRIAVIESMLFDDEIRAQLVGGTPLHEVCGYAEKNGQLMSFGRYASFLMQARKISAGEALLTVGH